MRKREHVIPLRLNKKELAYLEKQVAMSRMPREEYLRALVMGGVTGLVWDDEDFDGALTEGEKLELATEKNEIYKRLLSDMTPADLPEAVRRTLPVLRERGFALAIGSSSRNTKYLLSRIGLEGFFDAVSDGNNITRSKPDPEVFLKAAQYLSLAPEECLVVEDAKAGIEAAIAGGFDSAAMGDAVKCGLATYSLSGFDGLLDVCRESARA